MLSTLLFVLFAARPSLAPIEFAHAPEWLIATSKPETTLFGILVDGHSLADVERRFGRPSKVERDPEYPGEAVYHWRVDGIDLSVTTMFPTGTTNPSGQHVYSIVARGSAGKTNAKTRAGVGLGDTLDNLIAKYGTHYHTGYRKTFYKGVTIIFTFSDDTELAAGLNDEGRIEALQLTASIE